MSRVISSRYDGDTIMFKSAVILISSSKEAHKCYSDGLPDPLIEVMQDFIAFLCTLHNDYERKRWQQTFVCKHGLVRATSNNNIISEQPSMCQHDRAMLQDLCSDVLDLLFID